LNFRQLLSSRITLSEEVKDTKIRILFVIYLKFFSRKKIEAIELK